MSKVTTKLQVTVPKVIADAYGIRAGDELAWRPSGTELRVVRSSGGKQQAGPSVEERLSIFDAATRRQQAREKKRPRRAQARARGWSREDLYRRGRAD